MKILKKGPLYTFYADASNTVKITCPECNNSKSFNAEDYMTASRCVKAKCSCGHMFRCAIDFRKYYRKTVNFSGKYVSERTGAAGNLSITCISLGGIDFINMSPENILMKNDVLKVSFHLDDKNRTFIEREIKVRSLNHDNVNAAFLKIQAYDKELGFYLMP